MFKLKQKSKDPDMPAPLKRARHSRSFLLFSHHNPSAVRERHSCRDSSRLPGLMHFLVQHVQGDVAAQSHLCQLPILQEKGDLATRPIQPDDVQHIVAHFSRATGRHTSGFVSTLPHWTLWAAHFPIRLPDQGHDIPLYFLFLPPLSVRHEDISREKERCGCQR